IAASRAGQLSTPSARALGGAVSDDILTELYRGTPRYAGLKYGRTDRNPYVYPSEARELSRLMDALQRARPDDAKLPLVEDALVRLGKDDGWGTTDADGAALLALANRLASSATSGAVSLTEGNDTSTLSVSKGTPVARHTSTFAGKTTLQQ